MSLLAVQFLSGYRPRNSYTNYESHTQTEIALSQSRSQKELEDVLTLISKS